MVTKLRNYSTTAEATMTKFKLSSKAIYLGGNPKKMNFLAVQVTEIFDLNGISKRAKFLLFSFLFVFMLNNYVVQHIGSASMTARFGSFAIFLLLNNLSHDPHFSACQNIETLDGIQKISNFSLRRFSRYLTPNMALQKIILTSFFVFCFSSSRSRAMRSPRHNFSKLLSNRNEILQTCSGVNVVVPNTFWVHSVEGCRSWGTSK